MPTYSKETALYNTGVIANDISDAGTKATNYLAADSSGIMVYDGSNGVQTPSNPSTTTNNVFIDSDSLDIRRGTDVLATFGSSGAQIGKASGDNIKIDSSGTKICDGANIAALIRYDGMDWYETDSPYYSATRPDASLNINATLGQTSISLSSGARTNGESNLIIEGGDGTSDNRVGLFTSVPYNNINYASAIYGQPGYAIMHGESDSDSATLEVGIPDSTQSGNVLNLRRNSTNYISVNGSGNLEAAGGATLGGDLDVTGDATVSGDITVGGHSSPIGSRLSAVWTASSSSASGTAMTGSITLTPGVWMLGMITPTCSTSKAYYFANISSSLTYPYFTMGTGGSGWVPIEISTNTTTYVASGATTSCTYSNLTRGRILAVRIA